MGGPVGGWGGVGWGGAYQHQTRPSDSLNQTVRLRSPTERDGGRCPCGVAVAKLLGRPSRGGWWIKGECTTGYTST